MKKWFLVLLVLLVAYTYTGSNRITPEQAKMMIMSGDIQEVVDVRTAVEYNAGHYPGAVHIPVTEINAQTSSFLPSNGILVYCNTGQRARFASQQLTALGFTDVYYIAGSYGTLM